MKTFEITKPEFIDMIRGKFGIPFEITADQVTVSLVWENNTTDPLFDVGPEGGAEALLVTVDE